MSEFFAALARQGFLQNAVAAGLLAGLGCGIMGSYVVVKRMAFLAGGIAHAVLGGMGMAYFFGVDPLLGAVAAAVLSALIIGWVKLRARQHQDTLVSALWATGMAVGILFISRTPGYNADLMSYLFGNILMVSRSDLLIMAGLDLLLLVLVLLFHRPFLALAFDEEFARVRGVAVDLFTLLLLVMAALTVVLLIQVVGLILVIALLTLPAAIAGQLTRSLGGMMVLSVILGAGITFAGLALSYGPDLPAGATIILLAAAAYLAVTLARMARRGHGKTRPPRRPGPSR